MNKQAAWVYGAAIFLGSALLFNIQPMSGRILLPRFGGSAAVWTACLVAFQVLLLVGYGYAALVSRFRLSVQIILHVVLLAGAAFWPGFAIMLKPADLEAIPPGVQVLLAVCVGVGPAYFLLASGSTLLQTWLVRVEPGRNVYRLYALSNTGSLIGLFAYPFLIEPFLPISLQKAAWRMLFGGYVLLVAGLAVWMSRSRTSAASHPHPPPSTVLPPPALPAWSSHPVWWWILPLLSTFLLIATTTSMTYDITPIPMLWCLLLGSFLLSYIIGFSRFGEAVVSGAGTLMVCFFAIHAIFRALQFQPLWLVIVVGNGMILSGGVFLHGWLYGIRPAADRLAGYYLAIAAGGAVGGGLASLAAPVLFKSIVEFPGIILALAMLQFIRVIFARRRADDVELWVVGVLAAALMIMEPGWRTLQYQDTIWAARNFYGVLRVDEQVVARTQASVRFKVRALLHGSTQHGLQLLSSGMRARGTAYYGRQGGGFPILCQMALSTNRPIRVGVVGLGIGTLAAYGRPGDLFRFYEINPQVVTVAQDTNLFTYLSDSEAGIEITLGDARLSMAREKEAHEPVWDVLIVDAFSGDAVPVHLLTREAVELYLDRVATNGIVAFHITNRFVDLHPLLKAEAKTVGAQFWAWGTLMPRETNEFDSRWVVLTRTPRAFIPQGDMVIIPESIIPDYPVMTDEKGSVMALIDWRHTRMDAYLQGSRVKREKMGF